MSHRFALGQQFVYVGAEHPELRGEHGILLEALSPRLLLVVFDLPTGRQPVLKVAPEEVGLSESDALRFLRPERPDAHPTG